MAGPHRPWHSLCAGLVLWAALLSLAAPPARAGAGFLVDPVLVELSVPPGATHTVSLTVTPAGPGLGQLTAELADWLLDSEGNLRLLPAGTLPRSASRWLQLAPTTLVLGGQPVSLRLTAVLPQEALAGSYWSMLLLRGMPVADPGRAGVSIQVQLGVPVYLTIEGTGRASVQLVRFDVESPSPERPSRAVVQLRNAGNVHTRVTGQVEVRDEQGELVGRLPIPQGVILPGTTRRFAVQLPSELKPGMYVALATVVTQQQEFLVAEALFER